MEMDSSPGCDLFNKVVAHGHRQLEAKEFLSKSWSWTRELDEEGIFIFSYLLHDFRKGLLSREKLEEAVYTVGILLHKMLPDASYTGLSRIDEFQVIFNLYEKLKKKEMTWEASEKFVAQEIERMETIN